MLVVGLTGSIGMGKSAAAAHFRARGVPVCDADAEVHRLYDGEAVPAIAAAFPAAVRGGKVDRAALAKEVAGSPKKLKQLEGIVHPMVVKAEIDFLREQEKQGAFVVDSGRSLADMGLQIDKILESLRGRQGRVMERLRNL